MPDTVIRVKIVINMGFLDMIISHEIVVIHYNYFTILPIFREMFLQYKTSPYKVILV